MTLMAVRHHVSDYDAWLKVYTSLGQLQKSGGVLEESIHQDAKDPQEVLVLHRFANPASAEAFDNNPEIAEAMKRGGVDRPPRIEIYDDGKR